jgi:hypothetical protein
MIALGSAGANGCGTGSRSAKLIARMIGTQTVWKYTEALHRGPSITEVVSGKWQRPTALGTRREVEEFRNSASNPNVIKDLPTGRAVLITKISTAAALIVQVIPGLRHSNTNGR